MKIKDDGFIQKKYAREIESPDLIWHHPLYFIAFGFGSGAMPFAPGTFGTLMAVPFYLLLQLLPPAIYLSCLVILIFACSLLCQHLSQQLKISDHPGMCIDEFIGFFVTMIFAPKGWAWILLGIILFRIFDIWKPWPIRYIDQTMHSGFGMILDDVVAGLFAMVIMQVMAFFILS